MTVFAPKPPNDFREYIERYYTECRKRFPRIAAIAGKWTFEDLIPGLSDFDTRFIVEDGVTVQDWCDMSEAVGRVHLDLCRRFPHWDRNLEHLPGINLTWSELTGPATYYPEYPQWRFYLTSDAPRLARAQEYLAQRPWDANDEYFHLKKFCLYYGRYNRTIDPAVNLGAFESKYPLHSRFMHYFCPPLQSALCILKRRPIAGKMESVRLACELFPHEPVFEEMRHVVEAHYETPELYAEPELSRLEDRLARGLLALKDAIAPTLTLIPGAAERSISEWKQELNRAPVDRMMLIFDAAKFSRLMKGRLTFYGRAPKHFDTRWLIENELGRIRQNFLQTPVGLYWEMRTGRKVKDVMEALPQLAAEFLTPAERRGVEEFDRLVRLERTDSNHQQIALEIAAIFDDFYHALCKVVDQARKISCTSER